MRWAKIGIIVFAGPMTLLILVVAFVLIGPARLESFAIWLKPDDPKHYYRRGMAYEHAGRYREALADFQAATKLNDGFEMAFNEDAWLLATCPQADCRDGKSAVMFAIKARDLSSGNDPGALDTLATAYAEAGDFDQAVAWETKCLADPNLPEDRAPEIKARLALFQDYKPYHAERY
jgi:tetratricopeptide (TPR) repeat protein